MALNKNFLREQAKHDEERKQAALSGGGGRIVTIPYSTNGNNTLLRVLPARPETDGIPFHEITLHYGFIGGDGKNRVYVCSKEKHGACPICDRADWLTANQKQKEAQNIGPQTFFLYNIVDGEGKVKVLRAKKSQHREIRATMLREDGDITDLKTGAILEVERVKTDPYCRVWVKAKGALPDSIVNGLELEDLTSVYIENTPEELEKVLNGEDVNAAKLSNQNATQPTNSSPLLAGMQITNSASASQPEPVKTAETSAVGDTNLNKLKAMLQED